MAKTSIAGRGGALATRGQFLRVELSIPEAQRLLQEYAHDRGAALEAVSKEFRNIAANVVNQLLNLELSLFLGSSESKGNRRNGYHRVREYCFKGVGGIEVRSPRDRDGKFESNLIPSYERIDPRTKNDLALLHLAGISNRTMATISKRLLGIDVGKNKVSSSLGPLREPARAWLTRPLGDRKYWALYVDGTNFRVQRRGSVESEPSLVVVGVDETNHRSILAIEPGSRENLDAWRVVFRSLKARGLDGEAVTVGVMDGLPGLERLFREEFPHAVTARCWLHALKNSLEKVPSRLRTPFKELAHKVMYAASESDARKAFRALKDAMKTDGQRAVECLENDLDALVAHYRFEKRYWLALKTTNAVERVHREIKRRTKAMDALGEGNLEVLVAFTALKLEAGWRKHRIDSRALHNLNAVDPPAIVDQNAAEEAMEELSAPT